MDQENKNLKNELISAIMELTEEERKKLLKMWKSREANNEEAL